MSSPTYEQIYTLLQEQDQLHLLKYYEELEPDRQASLLEQISAIDWNLIHMVGQKPVSETEAEKKIEPLGAMELSEIEQRHDEFEAIGLEALRAQKTGAVLLAGGQGTRLGFDKPKGMFNIGVTRPLYIFECLINNLMDVVKQAGAWVPLYIMTSQKNHEETTSFFREHDYFGYDPEYIHFFRQDMAPSVDYNGKVLLEAKDRISLSPNGNGGWFSSLCRAGYLEDMHKKGIEWLSVFSVDNVLQRINDPVYVGAVLASGCDCGGKVVRKASPEERVGVLCKESGKPAIVEYYEMTDDMRLLRDENGNLLYNFGVTLNYLFRLKRLEEIRTQKLPVHIVEKKIPYINEKGEEVKPETPNGYKFEELVLDMIHMMDSCLPYEIVRENEFAPVKNREGVDSVDTARELLTRNGVQL
ncbi:MAG TPA: UDPGP type 1 family protein [Candidatus Fusicatenibacter merdavium]|uniref:UDPGP type 1 family protein n=1 Tax=Candidatus Fusicatenibacter merdavium TaxID=2838600 RepID=A0A9D2BK49_9FIRM|nr:UDPGP type 1 family protein [Candidatus Fusicatenibacter merdavium]